MCFDVVTPDRLSIFDPDVHPHTEPMPPDLARSWGLEWTPDDTLTRWHDHPHDEGHQGPYHEVQS